MTLSTKSTYRALQSMYSSDFYVKNILNFRQNLRIKSGFKVINLKRKKKLMINNQIQHLIQYLTFNNLTSFVCNNTLLLMQHEICCVNNVFT